MEKQKYYLFEKNAHGGQNFHKWTFEELKAYFEPNTEIASENEIEAYKKILTLEDLTEFIEKFANNPDGEHIHDYYIEKV